MKKIFIDIGMHDGQTLDEVTKDLYLFDKIYSFEPMKAQYDKTSKRFENVKCNAELILLDYGLADKTSSMEMYGSNADMGASLYQEKTELVGREQKIVSSYSYEIIYS